MPVILGLAGSLRKESLNLRLLRTARSFLPDDTSIEIATIEGIPLYDGDAESRGGVPAAVERLKERIVSADALLLATPEYNNGLPGAMKNAIDWLSRPASDIARVFHRKPTALCGASMGMLGSALAQAQWLPVLRHLGVDFWTGGRMLLPAAHVAFDANGRLVDATVQEQWKIFLNGFASYVADRP